MAKMDQILHKKCSDTLRMLAVDAVEKANSGHPGLPMGAADFSFALWYNQLSFNPQDPLWPNRDRFILSAGHGSMLLYGLLHLFGYELPIDELKKFRQLGSKTPGHPEYGHTTGVEMTTGPLGQGFASGVGMAIAAKMAAQKFNDEKFEVIDHKIYALVSDGDLMEGISTEAASLAGHLGLGNLIYIYDDNGITIDGKTNLTFSEDIKNKFKALGWGVQLIDGHDRGQAEKAIKSAVRNTKRPSLIIAKTHIAFGSPNKHDSSSAHGSPLGPQEAAATRKNLSWPEETFHVPAEVKELCNIRVRKLKRRYNKWQKEFKEWRGRNPQGAEMWDAMWLKKMPTDLEQQLLKSISSEAAATRSHSGKIIQKAAELVPALVGGSADLSPSTNTEIKGSPAIANNDFSGRNIHFGIREHAMAAIMNGLSLYGCFIPLGSTFLVFSDYCRPPIRLSALMKKQVIYVFTHDSVFVGEDGPTHQPIEHVSALRLIPNLKVIRPADGPETALAWGTALRNNQGPTAMILTRQKLPLLPHEDLGPEKFNRGGYVLKSFGQSPDICILASGSEVWLALEAAEKLKKIGLGISVISVPCLEDLLSQPEEYREALIPEKACKIALEAGRGALWQGLLGRDGLFIGLEDFGTSAPEQALAEKYGLTPEKVTQRIEGHLKQVGKLKA
jgi:transketolase